MELGNAAFGNSRGEFPVPRGGGDCWERRKGGLLTGPVRSQTIPHIRIPPAFRGNCDCGRWLIIPIGITSKNRLFCECGRSYWYNVEQEQFERQIHPAIFLDIDGVLINLNSKVTASLFCVDVLNYVVAKTEAVIVVSAARRKAGIEIIAKQLWNWRVIAKVVDITPDLSRMEGAIWIGVQRGDEIQSWLTRNKRDADPFVILDDESDMGALVSHLVKTDYRSGLTYSDGELAIAMLSRPNLLAE